MRAVRGSLAAAAILALCLGACGGDDSPDATPTPRREPTESGASLPEWAASFCKVVVDFEASVAGTTPSSGFAFEERKVRAIENFELYEETIADAVDGFRGIEAPEIADEYHQATIAQFEAIRAAYAAALPPLREVTDDAGIEAVNADLRTAREEAEREFQAQVFFVSPAVYTAIDGVPDCGGLSG